jgi:hypothetical protein
VRASDGPLAFDGATMGTTYRIVLGKRADGARVSAERLRAWPRSDREDAGEAR